MMDRYPTVLYHFSPVGGPDGRSSVTLSVFEGMDASDSVCTLLDLTLNLESSPGGRPLTTAVIFPVAVSSAGPDSIFEAGQSRILFKRDLSAAPLDNVALGAVYGVPREFCPAMAGTLGNQVLRYQLEPDLDDVGMFIVLVTLGGGNPILLNAVGGDVREGDLREGAPKCAADLVPIVIEWDEVRHVLFDLVAVGIVCGRPVESGLAGGCRAWHVPGSSTAR